MIDERDKVRTPWGWLRGFAWFLLAWPVLSLLAANELDWDDTESILIAMFGPAGIGLVLLAIDRLLTRFVGSAGQGKQPVPSSWRDVSNAAITLAVLLGLDVALVAVFESKGLFASGPEPGRIAVTILGGTLGTAVVCRLVHRVRCGPPRHTDLGEGWGTAPNVTRFLGYLTLIPTLLVCTVMLDYTMRGEPDFGLTAWIALPTLLLLGQRSAMARSPRYWALNPWETWLRQQSLALPWWTIALVVMLGTAVLFLLVPTGLGDEDFTVAGRIIGGILLVPMGALILWFVLRATLAGVRDTWRRWRVAAPLARDPTRLDGFIVRTRAAKTAQGSPQAEVQIRLRDGRSATFEHASDWPVVHWLRHSAPHAEGN